MTPSPRITAFRAAALSGLWLCLATAAARAGGASDAGAAAAGSSVAALQLHLAVAADQLSHDQHARLLERVRGGTPGSREQHVRSGTGVTAADPTGSPAAPILLIVPNPGPTALGATPATLVSQSHERVGRITCGQGGTSPCGP